jgi:hypothetical protein
MLAAALALSFTVHPWPVNYNHNLHPLVSETCKSLQAWDKRATDKKGHHGSDGNIHCHASSLGIGDKGEVLVVGPPLITERRKRRDGVDYERIFSSFCCVLRKHLHPRVVCSYVASSPVHIFAPKLKAELPFARTMHQGRRKQHEYLQN